MQQHGNQMHVVTIRPVLAADHVLRAAIEKCVKQRILNFFENKNIVGQNQYGFRNKHSTEHALINFMDFVTNELEKGSFVTGVYLDIKKPSTVSVIKYFSKSWANMT